MRLPTVQRNRKTRLIAAAAIGALLGSLCACSSTRTVQAYCGVVKQHKQRYLTAMDSATKSGGISGLIEGGAAIGDLASMWDDLAKVAPDDIQTDTERVRDAWNKIQDDAAEKKILAAATAALASAASMQRVNSYIADHCGVDAAPVGTGRLTTSSPVPDQIQTTAREELVHPPTDNTYAWDYGPRGTISVASSADDDVTVATTSVASDGIQTGSATISAPGIGGSNGDGNVVRYAVGAQQLDSPDPAYVVFSKTHTLASGLTPESWASHLQTLRADGQPEGTAHQLDECAEQFCSLNLATVVDGTAVLGYTNSSKDVVTAFDATAGTRKWTKAGYNLVALDQGMLVLEASSSGGPAVIGVDAQTGSTAWSFRDRHGNGAHSFGRSLGGGIATIYSTAHVGLQETFALNVVDLATGKVLAERFGSESSGSAAYDPQTKQIVLAGYADTAAASLGDGRHFEVLNADGQRTFSISPTQYAKLNQPGVLGAYAGVTWLDTSDGVQLINTATGSAASSASPEAGSSNPAVVRLATGSVLLLSFGNASARYLYLTADSAPSLSTVEALTEDTASAGSN